MLTRLDNEADIFATLQAVDQEPPCSLPKLIALVARLCPEDEDFEIIIRKNLVADSYKFNPTMLSKNVHAKISDDFPAHGAYTLSSTHIGLKFLRSEKKGKRHIVPLDRQSVMQRVLSWLDSDKDQPLTLPIENIPDSMLARPECFVYQVHRATDERIKFRRLKKVIQITLKNV